MCIQQLCRLLIVFLVFEICNSQSSFGKVPPRVESKPVLLDSFLPAAMQIMAHLTELMKYDIRPTTGPSISTTTTIRPTPSHKPAIYQPQFPPGPDAYFAKGLTYEEYVERLQNPSGLNYFDRYRFPLVPTDDEENEKSVHSLIKTVETPRRRSANQEDDQLNLYFGNGVTNVLRLINKIETDFAPKDIDNQVQEFSQNYDDSNFRFELLRQKKVPPTKAYVTLLSLYDLLNKESKTLGLNKYGGYSENVLTKLAESSTGTSAYQLRTVLAKVVERQDTRKPDILRKIETLIKDLDDDTSYINSALRYIPPLPFIL